MINIGMAPSVKLPLPLDAPAILGMIAPVCIFVSRFAFKFSRSRSIATKINLLDHIKFSKLNSLKSTR